MKKSKNIFLNLCILALLTVVCFCGYKIGSFYLQNKQSEEKITKIQEETTATIEEETNRWIPNKDTWNEMKSKNNDYVGWLLWDNDMISEPIVQGVTNQTYLRTDIYGSYDIWGTVFLDSEAQLSDDNLPIYGHSLAGYKWDTNKFSQLQNMTTQSFYESASTYKIYWENNISSYRVISACLVDNSSDEWSYTQSQFLTEEEKEMWVNQAISHSQITTNYTYTEGDKFTTFQTCYDDYSSIKYVIVGVETSSELYG